MRTVKISEAVWEEIAKRGKFGEEVDDVLRRVFNIEENWEPEVSTNSNGKHPNTILSIKFPDSTVIEDAKAADSFVKAIDKIGVERVRQLGLEVCRVPLVATQTNEQYKQRPLGRYFVMTHSSTKQKKEILERIAKRVGLSLEVNILEAGF